MRIILYGIVGLVCAVLAGGVFIFVAAPTGYVRDRLITEVKQRTGRDLVVAGDASFTIYPRLGVELENVTLSGPPGMEREALVRMERLKLAIPLLPLMRRELAIDEFVLFRPVIQLAVDDKGRRTWDFTRPAGAAVVEPVPPVETSTASGTAAGTGTSDVVIVTAPAGSGQHQLTDMLAGLSLGDVRIEQGEVRYANLLTGSSQRFSELNLKLALSSFDAPFEATGRLTWRKRSLPFTARLATLKSFLDGTQARLELSLDAEHLSATYDGKLDIAGIALLDGKLAVKTGSLRTLAEWTGAKLPTVGGLGPLDLTAHVTVAGPTLGLSKARLVLDGAKATGDITLDTGGARPRFKGVIAVDRLDLNVYLADDPAMAAVSAKSKKKAKAGQETGAGLDDIDATASVSASDAKTKPAKPKRAGVGWSTDPIELAGLKTADAEMTISAGALFYRDFKLGKSRIVLTLANGLLKARLPELAAYGGKGLGTIQIDGQGAMPRLTCNVTVNGVSALPLLIDAMGLDWIAGRGTLSLGFNAQGRSQKALVQTLSGQGRFAFTDGAIVGLNIPQMIRGLGQGKVSGLERDKTLKTDFSELSGTLSIAKGVVSNKDLNVVGPLIRVVGAGTIDLPARSLDYAAMPKIVASLEGQGGSDATGVTIPVRIQGPWARLKIVPDLEGLAKNPEAIADTVKQLGAKLKGADNEKVKNALDKLIGGKSSSDVESLIDGALGQ